MKSLYKRKKPLPRRTKNKKTGQSVRPAASPGIAFRPRLNPSLKPVLKEIGTPKEITFVPDSFQLEALRKLQKNDVIVSVPTGAGKTYIAVEAIDALLKKEGRAWYASPLKALSNSKFFEFSARFGSERVGLLTGDHKVNPDAPLIVGTTEILRNQLYDAMNHGENLPISLVVMDEAHYLGDPERGVVWEEVIIYLPPRVKLLLLSATVANADELADWLSFVRGRKTATVVRQKRPVPLHPLFLFPDGELTPLEKGKHLFPQVKHFIEKKSLKGHSTTRNQIPFGRILKALDQADLLPAIFFLKSRADCDQALARCFGAIDNLKSEQLRKLNLKVDELLEKYPFLRNHPHLKYLRRFGIAAHHAGHLPHWKLIIEQLMQEGLLYAIFSTSTVAAGVNFPARTVVISQSDRFNGREFLDLTATDLLQMTGRAGRRGMDHIGFALIVPGPFQDVQLIHMLFHSSPEPIKSQIKINFSMVLNLLLSHSPEEIKPLLKLSLASFQQRQPDPDTLKDIKRITNRLEALMAGGACTGPEQGVFYSRRIRELKKEARRLGRIKPHLIKKNFLLNALSPGRLFERQNGQIYCVIHPQDRRGRNGVLAARVRTERLLKKGQLRLKWIPFEKIENVLDAHLEIEPETKLDEIVRRIRSAAGRVYPPLETARPGEFSDQGILARHERDTLAVEAEMNRLPCNHCPLAGRCLYNKNSQAFKLLRRLEKMLDKTEESAQVLLTSFMRHLNFLKEEKFISANDELTEDGKWAAKLRLDQPLIIAAGIRAHAWPEDDPALLAALIAPFVMDNERPSEPLATLRTLPPEFASAWLRLEKAVDPLVRRQREKGFEVPTLNMRAALAIYTWATRDDWNEAVRIYGKDEGDLAMLTFRTADNLRQLASLYETHPALAVSARRARDLILREPVTVPL